MCKSLRLLTLLSVLIGHGSAQELPSMVPSTSVGPSSVPSLSIVPTPVPSVYPTIFQARITDPELIIAFDDNNTQSEVTLRYNISDLAYKGAVYSYDCNQAAPVANSSIALALSGSNDTNFSGDTHQLDVILDLKPDGLEADAMVFNGTDPEATTVEFCVRVDLLMDKSKFLDNPTEDVEVTFHQTKVQVIVNTTVGFNVSNINLETEYTELNEQVDFTYEVLAYQCDRAGAQSAPIIKQSESVFICAETTSDVSIRDIKSLIFVKDSATTLTAIKDRNPNAVTSKRPVGDKKWIVQSRLVSRFYSMDGTVTVNANGAVIMGFGGAAGRRLQQAGGGDPEGGFNAEFKLAPLEEQYSFDDMSSARMTGGVMGFLTIALMSLASLL